MIRRIHPMERIPRGYGFAYREMDTDWSFVAPIPLNFIIGWVYNFYWRVLVRGVPTTLRDIKYRAHTRGWDDGYKQGCSDKNLAWLEGYNAGVEARLTAIKAAAEVGGGRGLGRDVTCPTPRVLGPGDGNREGAGTLDGYTLHVDTAYQGGDSPIRASGGAVEVPEGTCEGRPGVWADVQPDDHRPDAGVVPADGNEDSVNAQVPRVDGQTDASGRPAVTDRDGRPVRVVAWGCIPTDLGDFWYPIAEQRKGLYDRRSIRL
jgi:hypothetical protein